MYLPVAIGMQQHQVGHIVFYAFGFRWDVVDVSTSFLRYHLVAVRTFLILSPPKS